MNIDLDAIRMLQQNKDAICEDVSLRSQSAQLTGLRAQARLERMNRARVNEKTLVRLTSDADNSAVVADQYRRLFNTLRCKIEL